MPGTAPTGWQNPKTSYSAEDVLTPEQFERIEGNAYATELGNRTIDPTVAPTGNVGTLRQFLDWFANRIKAITGKTNWYDAPPTTLTAAKSHIDAAAPHSGHATTTALTAHTSAAAPHSGHETPTGAQAKVDAHAAGTSVHGATSSATANRIIMRDANGRAKVATPSASDDISTKGYVDAKFDPSTGHKHDGTAGNGPLLSFADLGGWVQPGDTVLLSSPEQTSSISNFRVNITKVFQVARPGRYRIKGEISASGKGYIEVCMFVISYGDNPRIVPVAELNVSNTPGFIPFSLDMAYPVPPYGFIMLNLRGTTSGTTYVRNVTVCYAEGGSPPAPAVLKSI